MRFHRTRIFTTSTNYIKAITSYGNDIATETGDLVTNLILVATTGQRYITYDNILSNAPWGPPFDNNGNFRGDDVRQWLKSESDRHPGNVKAYTLVEEYWGEEWAIKWENKDVYLAFEPFFWGRIFKDNTSTGKWLCATSSMWGVMMDLYEINETHGDYTYSEEESGRGDSYTRRYTNNVFPNCVTLDYTTEADLMDYSIPSSGGLLENSEMYSVFAVAGRRQTTGYGLGIVWSDKQSQTSTYDEPLTTPAPAPDDKEELPYIDQITEGKYANIVKFYEEHHLDTEGNLIEEDTIRAAFTRTPTPRTITIEDEEPVGYTVKEWFTSPTNKSDRITNSSRYDVFKSNTPIATQGTTTGTITLNETDTTLYVLLVKEIQEAEPEAEEESWVLHESEIAAPFETGSHTNEEKLTFLTSI